MPDDRERKHTQMISIILPVYNAASSLDACIQSVLHQTCSDFELLVIDDGSTPQFLFRMLSAAEDRHADLVMCGYRKIVGNHVCDVSAAGSFYKNRDDLLADFISLYEINYLQVPWNKLYRASCIRHSFPVGFSLGDFRCLLRMFPEKRLSIRQKRQIFLRWKGEENVRYLKTNIKRIHRFYKCLFQVDSFWLWYIAFWCWGRIAEARNRIRGFRA